MLEANKSKWFEKIFAVYNRNLFRRKFSSLQVSGIEKLDKFPMLIYCNHSSWWDGLLAFEISREANLDSFLLMEEKQLKNLQLFRKLGVFSIVRENAREALLSLDYAAKILTEKQNRTLWIFPQGEILPNDIRPLKFFNGVSKIAEKTAKCYVFPLAIRYEFLKNFKPQIVVKIGEAELIESSKDFNSKQLTQKLETRLTGILDELKLNIAEDNWKDYRNII